MEKITLKSNKNIKLFIFLLTIIASTIGRDTYNLKVNFELEFPDLYRFYLYRATLCRNDTILSEIGLTTDNQHTFKDLIPGEYYLNYITIFHQELTKKFRVNKDFKNRLLIHVDTLDFKEQEDSGILDIIEENETYTVTFLKPKCCRSGAHTDTLTIINNGGMILCPKYIQSVKPFSLSKIIPHILQEQHSYL